MKVFLLIYFERDSIQMMRQFFVEHDSVLVRFKTLDLDHSIRKFIVDPYVENRFMKHAL